MSKTIKELIGDRLKKARKTAGISQLEMARALDVRQATISRWEHGEGELPARYLGAICRLLNMSFESLIETESALPTERIKTARELGQVIDKKDQEIKTLKEDLASFESLRRLYGESVIQSLISDSVLQAVIAGIVSKKPLDASSILEADFDQYLKDVKKS